MADNQTVKPAIAPADHKISSGFLKIGYERITPDFFYSGVDVEYKPLVNFKGYNSKDGVFTGETKAGYNYRFSNGVNFTPFIGVGVQVFSVHSTRIYLKRFAYNTVGFKASYSLNDHFDMGLNFKGNRSFYYLFHAEGKSVKSTDNDWSTEIGTPITWRPIVNDKWSLTWEPYIATTRSQNLKRQVGSHLSFAYSY
jgi:hypothetical protein